MPIGIYLYAPTEIFNKTHKYIQTNFNDLKVYGTSQASLFSKDFLPNIKIRNIKTVSLILPDIANADSCNQLSMVASILKTAQDIMIEKLNIVIFVYDVAFRKYLTILKDCNVTMVTLPTNGISDEYLRKCLVTPLLQSEDYYKSPDAYEKSSTELEAHVIPQVITHSEQSFQQANTRDTTVAYSTLSQFNQTMQDIGTSLEKVSYGLENDQLAVDNLEESLNNLTPLNNIEQLLHSHKHLEEYVNTNNDSVKNLTNQVKQVESQLENSLELYRSTDESDVSRRTDLSENIKLLQVQKDNLHETCDVIISQEKLRLLKVQSSRLDSDTESSINQFEERFNQLKSYEEIKDSKERIKVMTEQRNKLLADVDEFVAKFSVSTRLLESELNSEIMLLTTKLRDGAEELKTSVTIFKQNSTNQVLRQQMSTSKQRLDIIGSQIKALQSNQLNLQKQQQGWVDVTKKLVTRLQSVVGLDTNIINAYENLTRQLEQSKTIELKVENELAQKLEVVSGLDRVGKTAIALNYMLMLSKRQKRCCIIDLDLYSPELHYYTEQVSTIPLKQLMDCENAYELTQSPTWKDNLLVVNNLTNFNLLNQYQQYVKISEFYDIVLNKLSTLASCFDKIILILPLEISDVSQPDFEPTLFEKFYSLSGSAIIVSDVNPSSLTTSGDILTQVQRQHNQSRVHKIVINKFNNEDLKLINMRLGINFAHKTICIPQLNVILNSKFTSDVHDLSNSKAFVALM